MRITVRITIKSKYGKKILLNLNLFIFRSYENCVETEIQEYFLSLIGCIPLWFTDFPEKCGPLDLSRETILTVYDLFFGLYIGNYPTRCKPPCTTVHYEISYTSMDPKKDGRQMFIVFDQKVEVVKTQLVINMLSLVNRMGGIIGFCKEVLWILLILTGAYTAWKKWCYFILSK